MENTVKYFTLKLAAAATLSAALSSAAVAGGFMLTEQSVTGLGRAYAGAGIVGDDLSAVWYNPAGMSLFHERDFGDKTKSLLSPLVTGSKSSSVSAQEVS